MPHLWQFTQPLLRPYIYHATTFINAQLHSANPIPRSGIKSLQLGIQFPAKARNKKYARGRISYFWVLGTTGWRLPPRPAPNQIGVMEVIWASPSRDWKICTTASPWIGVASGTVLLHLKR